MNTTFKKLLALLRIAIGWLFFYAGITKVLDPAWSAEGYLKGAESFSGFFGWLASADILPITNFVNEWGLTVIGIALIIGIGARTAALAGAAMMILYWLPVLDFPYAGEHSYIVDEHIIYALVLLLLHFTNAGAYWGLQKKIHS